MRNTSKRKQIIIYIALIVWTIINIFPVYWMFTFSLKSNPEIFGENIIGLPKEWLWSNYETALTTGNMWLYFMNSAFMIGLTIPIHASIVPVYVTLSRMNMLNTYWALIIPYAAFSLAMAILVCVGFMNEIPRELDESACIDGCGVFGIFFRIIVPLMKPAVATVGIYTFLQCWNELMFANVFISNSALRTLPVGVQALSGQYTTEWGPIGAALVLATFPTLIVYIFLSKKIQESFIAGAVKG